MPHFEDGPIPEPLDTDPPETDDEPDLPDKEVIDEDEALLAQATRSSLEPALSTLVALSDTLRTALLGVNIAGSVVRMGLTDRAMLADLHGVLAELEKGVHGRRVGIEHAFRVAAVALQADQVRLADGYVALTPGAGMWATREQALRRELEEAVSLGDLSTEEMDEAIAVTVAYKVNHARLNYLARHRGARVAAAIERHRQRREADPLSAKVTFHRKPTSSRGRPKVVTPAIEREKEPAR